MFKGKKIEITKPDVVDQLPSVRNDFTRVEIGISYQQLQFGASIFNYRVRIQPEDLQPTTTQQNFTNINILKSRTHTHTHNKYEIAATNHQQSSRITNTNGKPQRNKERLQLFDV